MPPTKNVPARSAPVRTPPSPPGAESPPSELLMFAGAATAATRTNLARQALPDDASGGTASLVPPACRRTCSLRTGAQVWDAARADAPRQDVEGCGNHRSRSDPRKLAASHSGRKSCAAFCPGYAPAPRATRPRAHLQRCAASADGLSTRSSVAGAQPGGHGNPIGKQR
jgi:hypothetical protein